MQFRTEIPMKPAPKGILHGQNLVLIGSCFAQNIGLLLQQYKFGAVLNPTGIVYNPFSVNQTLHWLLTHRLFTPEHLYHTGSRWVSFAHHGSFSHSDAAACVTNINQHLQAGRQALHTAQYLFLTFGTAYVYRLNSTGMVSANCHKLPDALFTRSLLTVSEITAELGATLHRVLKNNPQLQVVLTVSPIRHWKDGAVNNQLSKATLILAAHELVKNLEGRVTYFPAYELMMDDLRDYRFYADDMLHPSPVAIDYIWQKFKTVFFEPQTLQLMAAIDKVNQARKHKPLFANSPEYRDFARRQLQIIRQLQQQRPYLHFEEELKYFEQAAEGGSH
ncbi:MAG TPA: GSCFA domain-containing protein [Chitinophagales bacterium]|nr:GSCFA domain-containing protein [Chitinophagales bacterium]HRK28838.1 GSCFA domain-containing protein [Chitinophagales bacterium]